MSPPDYHLASFWDARFKHESIFEWLGDGRDTIIPPLREYLTSRCSSNPPSTSTAPRRLLHIGAGTSALSEYVWEAYTEELGANPDDNAIVNLDFSETAVQRGVEVEAAKAQMTGRRRMQWARADALKWGELAGALGVGEGELGLDDPFDIVLDKSTADAISCADNVLLHAREHGIHPVLARHLLAYAKGTAVFSPVELLALHLASIVRPTGVWIALSFSANRFSFMSSQSTDQPTTGFFSPARYWRMERIVTVPAPSGLEKEGVHTPVVEHYVYLMRRSDALFQ